MGVKINPGYEENTSTENIRKDFGDKKKGCQYQAGN